LGEVNTVLRILNKKAKGNTSVLDRIMLSALERLHTDSKTEDFDDKCRKILDTVCKKMGEEHRDFYADYMEEMKKRIDN